MEIQLLYDQIHPTTGSSGTRNLDGNPTIIRSWLWQSS